MSSDRPSARWRFLMTPRWLAWHAFVIAAVIGMLWLGVWQFRRAESGNALSWAYTFEWPVFAAFGVVFYVRTILDEVRGRRGGARTRPGAGHRPDRGRRPARTAPGRGGRGSAGPRA